MNFEDVWSEVGKYRLFYSASRDGGSLKSGDVFECC